jgi:Baseplate J-like protein
VSDRCCEPADPPTPLPVENRPGLSALTYRVGDYASFREAMLESLARRQELSGLTTRRSDDYSITLLELWAAVGDVLTFYQERLANEAFLGTARRQESVSRLAALIGYSLAPGAAALSRLSFTIEAGRSAQLPVGLRVQSLPGPGELPQVFETLEPLLADARLNKLRVFPAPVTSPGPLAQGQLELTLDRAKGPEIAAALAAGARVVIFADGQTTAVEEKTVAAVRTHDDRAVVTWAEPIVGSAWGSAASAFAFTRTFRLFGHGAPATFMQPSEVFPSGPTITKLGVKIARKQPSSAQQSKQGSQHRQEVGDAFIALDDFDDVDVGPRIVWSLRTTTYAYPGAGNAEEGALEAGTSRLCLDSRYEGLAPGRKLLVADTRPGGIKRLVTITRVDQVQDVLGALADTVTRLTVSPAVGSLPDRRSIVVYELGRQLVSWAGRYPARLTGDTLYLPGRLRADGGVEIGRVIERGALTPGVVLHPSELAVGRELVLSDAAGKPLAARLKNPPPTVTTTSAGEFCHLVLRVEVDGTLDLETATATLEANVVRASHGETVRDETVGSGNASVAFQRFVLKRKPLTYVPGAGEGGVESSLELFVNGVRWHEVPTLLGRGPDARAFVARLAEDGSTELRFGDGVEGARLPSGQANVRATYRTGLGLAGRVKPRALTSALDRPTGLLAVTNPLPATGGADPETRDAARRNAPRTVRTFGRAVSLRDFEDLATASGEVAKAQATWAWDGLGRAIHVTVAAQEGGVFSKDDLRRLAAALTAARDPNHPLRLANYVSVDVVVRASVGVEPDRKRSQVGAAAREALLQALSFDALDFGRPVQLSDVFRVLQSAPGVAVVDVDVLDFKDPAEQTARRLEPGSLQPRLAIFSARADEQSPGGVRPGELARVESPTQDVTITPKGGLHG